MNLQLPFSGLPPQVPEEAADNHKRGYKLLPTGGAVIRRPDASPFLFLFEMRIAVTLAFTQKDGNSHVHCRPWGGVSPG
jgi:hypothetical protein